MSWNMQDQSAARSLHSSQGVETARRDLCRELKGSAAGTGLLREVNEGNRRWRGERYPRRGHWKAERLQWKLLTRAVIEQEAEEAAEARESSREVLR